MSYCEHDIIFEITDTEDVDFEIDVRDFVDRIVAPDEYSGVTEVTPSDSEQVLPTKDKLVRADITVYPAPTEVLSTDHNGTFTPSSGKVGFSEVTVDVEPNLETLSVTENGLYLPESGTDGFDRVNVDVPVPSGSTTITQNGTYNVEQYASAVVDVPDQYFVKQWTEESENLVFCNYWSNKITDRDESAYIYVMKFYGNTHSNGVQLLLYGVREDTKVIAIRGNAYRLIDGINYYDPSIYDLFTSAGTIVKVYRIPKTA